MSMITAAQWVPRGFAAPFPKKYSLDEKEYERIAELAKLQLDDAQEDLDQAEQSHEVEESGTDDDGEGGGGRSGGASLRPKFVCILSSSVVKCLY